MVKVRIYGFPPISLVHTDVVIYDERISGSSKNKLFSGNPNEQGVVTYEIPKIYIGQNVGIIY